MTTLHLYRVYAASAHDFVEVWAKTVADAAEFGAGVIGCEVEDVVVRYVLSRTTE